MSWKAFHQCGPIAVLAVTAPLLLSQQKPLTNADVITMVKGGVSESVVVSAIQSRPGRFSTSTSELVRLHKAGVTDSELNAMIAATSKTGASGAAASAPPQAVSPVSKSRMPTLIITSGQDSQALRLEKTQLATTKTKPSSMSSLATDSVLTQAMQGGANEAAMAATMHMNSMVGGESVQQAASISSNVMSHRQPTITYVWGVPGPASSNIVKNATPSFTLDFSRVLGVTPDDSCSGNREADTGAEYMPDYRRDTG